MTFGLSIAIPTYRSAATLFDLLRSIEGELLTLKSEVAIEVIISDNDPDSEVIKLINATFSQGFLKIISYFKNENNVGYDLNLLRLSGLAQYEYVKFIADDDLFMKGYLSELLANISHYSPDIIVDEFTAYSSILPSQIAQNKSDISNINPPWSLDKFNQINGRFGQISSLAFRTDLIRDLRQNVESNFIHMFWFYSIFEKCKVLYNSTPYICVKLGSPNFSNGNFQIIDTQLKGINAIYYAPLSDSTLKDTIYERSVQYAFKYLKLMPRLRGSERYLLLKRHGYLLLREWKLCYKYLYLFFIPKKLFKVLKIFFREETVN